MMGDMSRSDGWCLLLYVTFAVATGFADLRMRTHTDHVVKVYIPGVVAGTENAPGKYRVFAPMLIEEVGSRHHPHGHLANG